MLHAPAFWQRRGLLPTVLRPLGAVTAALTARRLARPSWHAPVPVICCGNVTVGGAGKTTVALDLARRLVAGGTRVHVLLRGYGGVHCGVRRVGPEDDATLVGDEALLLAAVAPTWIGADRAASARAAIAAGAEALVLDDGLQNPTLAKDLSLLVVDGGSGFGNGLLLPAGPLRETVAAGAARCAAAVLIGEDRSGAAWALPIGMPVLRARLRAAEALCGGRFLAFAGIAHPAKFFATAEQAGAVLVGRAGFPDHHRFTGAELRRLRDEAERRDARLLTTAKDAVRLPRGYRETVTVLGVTLDWDDPARLDAMLGAKLSTR